MNSVLLFSTLNEIIICAEYKHWYNSSEALTLIVMRAFKKHKQIYLKLISFIYFACYIIRK